MKKILMAVYGTLKKGEGNHHLLHNQSFVGEGVTTPDYTLMSFGGFPGVFKGKNKVAVEVYSVDHAALEWIDQLEGHPQWYRRAPIPITLSDGTQVAAWMYTLCHEEERGSKMEPNDDNVSSWSRQAWRN